jgi:hypothetical protein
MFDLLNSFLRFMLYSEFFMYFFLVSFVLVGVTLLIGFLIDKTEGK